MSQNNLNSNTTLNQGDEISLPDVMLFLRRFWVVISVTGFIGLVMSLVYVLIAPKQYEGVAQIQMARISTDSSPLGINIEEPSMLNARMSIPSTFTLPMITVCGMNGRENAASFLAKSIKMSQPIGSQGMVEMRVIGSNPDILQKCANAIFELVKTFQNQIITPYISEAKNKLTNSKIQLDNSRKFILQVDQSESRLGAAYLSNRDQIHYLLNKIEKLEDIVEGNTIRETRLLAPIYIREIPLSPKKQVILSLGLLGGIFLGLLIALLYQMICKFRAQQTIQKIL